MKRTKLALLGMATVAALLIGFAAGAGAATLTWEGDAGGLGDDHSWNDPDNWAGTRPTYFDTLHITTTDTIDNVYQNAAPGTSTYRDGGTWRGVVNLNQGTISTPGRFETGQGVFNIGDGVLTGGVPDAIVSLGGTWIFDRHSNGTYNVNIKPDGMISGGNLPGYSAHTNRKFLIDVQGGSIESGNWNFGNDLTDVNKLRIADYGTVKVGAVTIDANDVIDFASYQTSGTFTANYGGTFPIFGAVQGKLGSNFTASGGGPLNALDNGNGTFTVYATPEPATLLIWSLLAGLGIGLGWRRRK